MGRAISMARDLPRGKERGRVFGKLRRGVVAMAVLGLVAAGAGAAVVTAFAVATTRTLATLRSTERTMVQAAAMMTPGALVLASRARRPATNVNLAADITGSIPPTQSVAELNGPTIKSNRDGKADRLPLPVKAAIAAATPATPDFDQVPTAAPKAEQPPALASAYASPDAEPPKTFKLASVAPTEATPDAPAATAMPMPLHRPAEKPRRTEDDAADIASRTAVYDIAGKTVHMPNGVKLAAHSGFGDYFDDPRYTKVKNQGPTPPNVYRLSLRERPFHGVRAIRLNPVFEDKMFGRDGMLAHSYLLGPRGDSNGCVSFEDYDKFLNAFLRGEVDRMVVVPDLKSETLRVARARGRQADRFALNNQ